MHSRIEALNLSKLKHLIIDGRLWVSMLKRQDRRELKSIAWLDQLRMPRKHWLPRGGPLPKSRTWRGWTLATSEEVICQNLWQNCQGQNMAWGEEYLLGWGGAGFFVSVTILSSLLFLLSSFFQEDPEKVPESPKFGRSMLGCIGPTWLRSATLNMIFYLRETHRIFPLCRTSRTSCTPSSVEHLFTKAVCSWKERSPLWVLVAAFQLRRAAVHARSTDVDRSLASTNQHSLDICAFKNGSRFLLHFQGGHWSARMVLERKQDQAWVSVDIPESVRKWVFDSKSACLNICRRPKWTHFWTEHWQKPASHSLYWRLWILWFVFWNLALWGWCLQSLQPLAYS